MAHTAGAGPLAPLSEIFLKSLYALADAGQAEAACRFAGHAYVLLRQSRPAEARHFDALAPAHAETELACATTRAGFRNRAIT